MVKKVDIEETDEEDNSGIEINTVDEPIKPVKEKKPYVLTEARKKAFENARLKRQANIDLRKAQQKQLQDEQEAIKNAIIEKRNRNLIKKNKKEIKKIIQSEDLLSSSSDEEIIIKKKHPGRKVLYVRDDSDDEIRQPPMKLEPVKIPQRIIQYL
jgi:hypothetical protein